MEWHEHQDWESSWWGNCVNTLSEEIKQQTYAVFMGLSPFSHRGHAGTIDMHGASVLDVGGGPVSLLLKCINVKGTVLDPCSYPDWIDKRYAAAGISYMVRPAEDKMDWHSDEVWCYNVLQHTQDPEKIIANMRQWGKLIRLFEWVDTLQTPGHPHILREKHLNAWLHGEGKVTTFNDQFMVGTAYSGIFPV